MDYTIRTKDKMRYPTAGDYFAVGQNLTFVDIKRQDFEEYEFLIMIHELIEEFLTRKRGITEKSIMDFDLFYEKEREEGLHSEADEPGHDPRAPYVSEHKFAEMIEKQICVELNFDWDTYGENIKS